MKNNETINNIKQSDNQILNIKKGLEENIQSQIIKENENKVQNINDQSQKPKNQENIFFDNNANQNLLKSSQQQQINQIEQNQKFHDQPLKVRNQYDAIDFYKVNKIQSIFEQRDASILNTQLNNKNQEQNFILQEKNNEFQQFFASINNSSNFINEKRSESPDGKAIDNLGSKKFPSPLKTQKNSSGSKINFSSKKSIISRNEKDILMKIQNDNPQIPTILNRYNSQILEQSRTQRVSPQFVQNPNEHRSIQQNGSARSYSFQARSPMRQQIARTPHKDTHINIGSNSRQGLVKMSPCPIRFMQMQSSKKPLLNLVKHRKDSQGQTVSGAHNEMSDQVMSDANKNSPYSEQSKNQNFPNTSSKQKNQDMQYFCKQNKINDNSKSMIEQGMIDSAIKQKAQIKLSDSKKFIFSQNYFQSPFKSKSQNIAETPVKEGKNSSSQKKHQNTLRGYQIISSSKKNDNLIYDKKQSQQKIIQESSKKNLEIEDEQKENVLSSNTTKKQFVTKFKGGSQVKSNFKLNQNSLQVKECIINQKRTTDSKNYKNFLQAYENDERQNENININNIHYLSNNKNSERQSGRSNYHLTINSLSQNLMQRQDDLMIIAGSNKNLKNYQKQEFSPCRKFMHQDSSIFEKEKKNSFSILNNDRLNNHDQPIISPNFNFKGKIDSKAIKGLSSIKFDSQNVESPLSQKKRKGLFIDHQNIKSRFDQQQIVNNMKKEFVEDPKKYENQKWFFNNQLNYNQKIYDSKKDGFNPYFFNQPDFNLNQNMHQMMFNYQNQFQGIKHKHNFYSNFEQVDLMNQKSYSKKKKKPQSSHKTINDSKNKQTNNYNHHDSAQKLIKDKKYIGINSNTKDDAYNEVQGHNRMIPLICPSIVNVGGRMNETFKLAQQLSKENKMMQQSSISPTSLKKSKIFCNNSGTTVKRHQYSIQGTDSGQKNGDQKQVGSSGGKEYGHSGFQQTPSDMQDVQSSSNDEEGEDDFDDEEECSSSQPTSGDKSIVKPHFLRKKSRKYEYEFQQYYLHCLQQQENYNFHYHHFQKDNFRIHMDGIFSASYIPRQQFPSFQYPQIQANFMNHIQQQQNRNFYCQQTDKQKYKSHYDREDRFSSSNKISKEHNIDQENEKESFRIPLVTSKREQIKSPCYQKNYQSNSKNDIKNPEIEVASRDQEMYSKNEKMNSQKKTENRNQKRFDYERECIEESKSGAKKGGDVGQINIICPMINHYCSHGQTSDQCVNHQSKNCGQLYQQKFQNSYLNGYPFHNQLMENQGYSSFQHQIMQNQFNSFIQNNHFNQNVPAMMGYNNQFGLNFLPGFGNTFLNGAINQNQYFPQMFPQSQMGLNNLMQQQESNISLSNQINGLSDNKNKNDQKKINLHQDSQKIQINNGYRKQEEDIDQNLGKRSFQAMNGQIQMNFEEKILQKKKRFSKLSKQEQMNESQQNNPQIQNLQQQSPKQQKRRRRSQKNENQQNNMQDVEYVSESQDMQNLQLSFQNTFNENSKNIQDRIYQNDFIQHDVFDKPDDPKETRTIKKKSGIDQTSSSLMQKTFFQITPQKSLNMVNNGSRVGGTAPHYHSNTGAQSTQITPIRNINNSQQKSAQYINMPIFDPCSAPSGDTIKDEDAAILQPDDQMTIGQGGSIFLNQNDQDPNYCSNHYFQDKDQNINKDDVNTEFQSNNIFQQNQYSIQFISKRENNLQVRKKQRQFSSKRSENYNEYGGQLSIKLAQQQKDFLNKQNEANIQKMIERIEQETIDQKELFRKIENGESTVTQCKGCKCKGQCLKLYCECLRNNALCGQDCQCTHNGACFNNLEHKQERRYAIEQILKRNINAFDNKVDQKNVHSKGCNCKNSGCQKRYCECYERNVPCTDKCKCKQCKNDKIFSSSNPDYECNHQYHQINNSEEASFQVNHALIENNQKCFDDSQFRQNQKNKEFDKMIQLQNCQTNNNGFKIFQLVENNIQMQNQKGQLFESQKQSIHGNLDDIDKKSFKNHNLEADYKLKINEQENFYDIEQLQSNEVLQNFNNEQENFNNENDMNCGNIHFDNQNNFQETQNENFVPLNRMIQKQTTLQKKQQNQTKHFRGFDQINCSFDTSKAFQQNQNDQSNSMFTNQNDLIEKDDESNLVTFNNQLTVVRQNENNQSENQLQNLKLNALTGRQNLFETKQDSVRKKQKKRGDDLIRKNQVSVQQSQLIKSQNLCKIESLPSDNQIKEQFNDQQTGWEIELFQTPDFSNQDQQNGFDFNQPSQLLQNQKLSKFQQNIKININESAQNETEDNLQECKSEAAPIVQKKDLARASQRANKANHLQKQSTMQKQSDVQTRQMRNIQSVNDDYNDPIILEIQLKHEDKQNPPNMVKSVPNKSKSRNRNLKIEKMETRHQRKLREQNEQNQQPQDQQINGELQ